MVEPEVAYADLDDVMELAEEFVSEIIQTTIDRAEQELERLDRDTSDLEQITPPFPRISYTEAVDWLNDEGFDMDWGDDFGSPEETALSERYDKPVLIHRFPMESKAFYMKPDPDNPDVALCVDMIAPEGVGEIIGGGQREDDLEALDEKVNEHDLPREAFEWYLDLRKYGSVPHGGFGLGLERTVAWLCGTHHVRETIPFPRQLNRMYP
jgi:asparaginyl-tRNA synthetase